MRERPYRRRALWLTGAAGGNTSGEPFATGGAAASVTAGGLNPEVGERGG